MRRARSIGYGFILLISFSAAAPALAKQPIDSGAPWNDVDGKAINAHGGGLLQKDGTYYWYGEIKSGLT